MKPLTPIAAIKRLLRDWTLPVAIVAGIVVYVAFAYIPALDSAGDRLLPWMDVLLPLAMAMILFVNFCRIDFHAMRLRLWHWQVTAFQLATVAIAVAITLSHNLSPRGVIIVEGLLTCVIGPGAAAAAVVTGKLGGDMASMTTYTFLSNIVTAVMVPIVFPLIDPQVDMPFVEAFLKILYKVALVLLVPMAAAYVVKHRTPRLLAAITAVPDLAFYLWGISLALTTGVTARGIAHSGQTVGTLLLMAVVSALLCMMQFAVGRWIGRRHGITSEGGQALGQKNTSFAVWIAYTYLSPVSSVVPGCYILWQNIVNSIELYHHRLSTTIKK